MRRLDHKDPVLDPGTRVGMTAYEIVEDGPADDVHAGSAGREALFSLGNLSDNSRNGKFGGAHRRTFLVYLAGKARARSGAARAATHAGAWSA
jgi:hypothetical protein